jgi:hypothetical protein
LCKGRFKIFWTFQDSFNEGISAASFCHQVAALVSDMFYNSRLERLAGDKRSSLLGSFVSYKCCASNSKLQNIKKGRKRLPEKKRSSYFDSHRQRKFLNIDDNTGQNREGPKVTSSEVGHFPYVHQQKFSLLTLVVFISSFW